VGRATAGAAAVVITPPDTLSTVVPGLESWDEADTDFRDPSKMFKYFSEQGYRGEVFE